jgi:hypothetical protein
MMKKWDLENKDVEWKVDEISVNGTLTCPNDKDPHAQ